MADAAAQTSIEQAAEQMKAAARADAEQAKAARGRPKKTVAEREPVQIKRRPRAARVAKRAPAESLAVAALRREIAGHERRIKQLNRALRAIGA